jgi:hypothetical protein
MGCQLKGKLIRVHHVDAVDEKAKYEIYEAALVDDCGLSVGEVMFSVCDSGVVEIYIKDVKDIRAEHGYDVECDCEECEEGVEALDEDGDPIEMPVATKGKKKAKKGDLKISELVDSNHEIA